MLTPMQQMERHFTENFYKRMYAVLRKAYRIGGREATKRVILCVGNEKHGFTENGRERALKAYVSFIRSIGE